DLGPGRPGWHVECTAIALNRLGNQIDLNGGGSDLIFPHHEFGAAHAEAFTGVHPFARHYVHTGMIGLDGEKMSKSRGNLVFVSKLRAEDVDPNAVRLALIAGHYRSDRAWTDELLATAQARLARWRSAVALPAGPPAHDLVTRLRTHLPDHLHTPGPLAAVAAWVGEALERRGRAAGAPGLVRDAVGALFGVALWRASASRARLARTEGATRRRPGRDSRGQSGGSGVPAAGVTSSSAGRLPGWSSMSASAGRSTSRSGVPGGGSGSGRGPVGVSLGSVMRAGYPFWLACAHG